MILTNMKNEQEAELTIELPYIYYLGYRVYANGSEIEYKESDNGFVQIKINPALYEQNVKINVRYTGTNEMIVASAISIISAMIIVISEIILNMKNLKLKRGIKIYLVLILFKTKACHFMYFIVKYIM